MLIFKSSTELDERKGQRVPRSCGSACSGGALAVPRRYQPVGRNITLLRHLLDCVALVGCLDGAEPYGFVGLAIDVQDDSGDACGLGDCIAMPPKSCVARRGTRHSSQPSSGVRPLQRRAPGVTITGSNATLFLVASSFDRPPAGGRDPIALDLDRRNDG